jgi:LmbE family N-acetylglucosaminyl deacetylase
MIDMKTLGRSGSLKVLCLGAHSDDIEIGCGGTILKLIRERRIAEIRWIVLSSDAIRKREAERSAKAFLAGVAVQQTVVQQFKDGFFPYVGGMIKEYFESLKRDGRPDLVFTHFRADLHQDHRLVSDLTWNTFRDHLILEYEIPKYDADLGAPNTFVHLDEGLCRRKVRKILANFKTQAENQWFTEETFMAILRIRGIESNAPSGYAEAFHCRKQILC